MAYKVGSNTVINDSGKLAGIGLIDGVNISGTVESGSALVYDGANWVAGAGGKTVMKVFPTTAANADANPSQWSALDQVQYEVTTDSMLQDVRAEYIVWKLNDVQVANVALANYTEGTVGGDSTIQRHRQNIDLTQSPALSSIGDDNVIKVYAIDGVNNQSNTVTIATTEIVAPSIAAPTLVTPTDSATGQNLDITLVCSTYSVIGHDEAHASTDWQLATTADFSSGFIDNVTANTGSKLSFSSPATLTAVTTYYWRSRFRSASYVSPYPTRFSFTTLAAVGSNGQTYSQGEIANNGVSVIYDTPGSYTFTVPAIAEVVATVVGAGGGGGRAGQPAHGGGGGGGARAKLSVSQGQSMAVVVGGSTQTQLSTSSNASGQASTVTLSGQTLTGNGGQAQDDAAQQQYAFSDGGTAQVAGGWTSIYNAAGGYGGTGDGNTSGKGQPGGQGYAGGGGGGYNWTSPTRGPYPGGQGQGWWGGGGGGNGAQGYPASPGTPGQGGAGNPVYGTNAQGRGYPGGSGATFATGQAGGGPSGGPAGSGGGSGSPSGSGGGGGGSYGGGGGNGQGWSSAGGGKGAHGYVRFDWATGE